MYKMATKTSFGLWLDAVRVRRGMTRAQLAEKAGLASKDTLYKICAGLREPFLSTAIKIARALGVSGDEVFARYAPLLEEDGKD